MNFIKSIFEKKPSEEAHRQFSRFSKGVFENKALIDINRGKTIKLKTSAEFANELVYFMAKTIEEPVLVRGIVFSTRDLRNESSVEFEDVKSAMGVRKHIVNCKLKKEQLIGLCESLHDASLNLSFSTRYGSLQIKEKTPKSGKPGKGNEEPKADFCILITDNESILEDYAFDIKNNFKKLFIKHTYDIKEIIIPDEYKNDFAMARKMGLRKGKILRFITIDGKEDKHEMEFSV